MDLVKGRIKTMGALKTFPITFGTALIAALFISLQAAPTGPAPSPVSAPTIRTLLPEYFTDLSVALSFNADGPGRYLALTDEDGGNLNPESLIELAGPGIPYQFLVKSFEGEEDCQLSMILINTRNRSRSSFSLERISTEDGVSIYRGINSLPTASEGHWIILLQVSKAEASAFFGLAAHIRFFATNGTLTGNGAEAINAGPSGQSVSEGSNQSSFTNSAGPGSSAGGCQWLKRESTLPQSPILMFVVLSFIALFNLRRKLIFT